MEVSRKVERQDSSRWWFWQRDPIDRFTGWLVAWTAILSLATILSAIVLYKTDHTLQRTVIATQRPWITVKVEIGGIRFTPQQGLIQSFSLTLKNVGNSVATFVEDDLKFIALKEGSDLDYQSQTELCRGVRLRLGQSKSKVALFPSEESVPFYSRSLTAQAISAGALGNPPRFLNLALVGCVAYRSEFTEDIHETGYVFWIRQKVPALPMSGRLVELGKDIPKEELEFYGGTTFAR